MGGIFKSHRALRAQRERQEQRANPLKSFLHSIRNWHLILILLPLMFLAATFLRLDHLKMVELREAVLTADHNYDDDHIKEALLELKNFTSHHMIINFVEKNGVTEPVFGTGPIYLEQQYSRQAAVALADAEARLAEISDSNPNGNVFAQAMSVCQPRAQANGWAWNSPDYINCYNTIINSFPTTDELTTLIIADIPSTALFRYDFASPVWYPSLAGWTVLACVILIIIILVRAIYWIGLQIALRLVK